MDPSADTPSDFPVPPWDRVAIIGVGLLGGSLGLALKARGEVGGGDVDCSLPDRLFQSLHATPNTDYLTAKPAGLDRQTKRAAQEADAD
ncbi:MAG: hypothetical protein ACK44Z_01395, partial [Pirellulaceae bacterium]